MHYKYLYSVVIFGSALIIFFSLFPEEQTTVKYFPFDENVYFTEAKTELSLHEEDTNKYEITWESASKTNETIYLRQDLSILYVDGELKGIQSRWIEDEIFIYLASLIPGQGSSHYQAITYHHGESHYPDTSIKSNNTMTFDELYVVDSEHTPLITFKEPKNREELSWKDTLDHTVSQHLHFHWHTLIDHFNLNYNDYIFVPLTDLHLYEKIDLPGLNQLQARKVIAQLWEGLYKNYVIPFKETKTYEKSYVPLVLFDKKGEHLIVLFQDHNGQYQKLMQNYGVN